MDYSIDITKVIDLLFARLWLIIIVFILSVVAAFYYIDDIAPNRYTASATVSPNTVNGLLWTYNHARVLIADYEDAATSYTIAEMAAQAMETEITPAEIQSMISAEIPYKSTRLDIYATGLSPELTVEVVNAVAYAFAEHFNGSLTHSSISVLDTANESRLIYNGVSDMWGNRFFLVAAATAGIIGIISLFAIFDFRVVLKKEATLDGRIELLGVVPNKNSYEKH